MAAMGSSQIAQDLGKAVTYRCLCLANVLYVRFQCADSPAAQIKWHSGDYITQLTPAPPLQ